MVTDYGSYMLFLTFITYRLPWHLVENIIIGSYATGTAHYHVPQNGHFLSTYRLLSRLAFKHDPSFLWKTNFKSKPDALSKGWNIKHFLLWCRPAKLTELFSFASFQRKLNRQKQSSHFLYNFVDVT